MSAVYLDHNATTPLRPEAREALLEALELGPLNASSAHGAGRAARALLDDCLLYTSPSPRDLSTSRMPSSA